MSSLYCVAEMCTEVSELTSLPKPVLSHDPRQKGNKWTKYALRYQETKTKLNNKLRRAASLTHCKTHKNSLDLSFPITSGWVDKILNFAEQDVKIYFPQLLKSDSVTPLSPAGPCHPRGHSRGQRHCKSPPYCILSFIWPQLVSVAVFSPGSVSVVWYAATYVFYKIIPFTALLLISQLKAKLCDFF